MYIYLKKLMEKAGHKNKNKTNRFSCVYIAVMSSGDMVDFQPICEHFMLIPTMSSLDITASRSRTLASSLAAVLTSA